MTTHIINKTVFLDRDGVINQDSPLYIKSPDEFIFIPGSTDAIKCLSQNGFDVMVITNQSVIGRKMIPQATLDAIFEKMNHGIEEIGGKIKDIFFCPHAPEDGCDCRKPKPGMIENAHKKYGMDLSTAFVVGDSPKDIECAMAAGVGHTALVKTGNGIKAQTRLAEKGVYPDHVGDNLLDVARWIISR